MNRITTLSRIVLITTCLFSGCKKLDTANNVQVPARKDFFSIPANAPSAIKRTVAEFERQNKITGFVKELVASEGMPLWDKSIINVSKRKNIPTAGFDGDGSFEIEDTLVFTPIVEEDSLFVNGFFLSKVSSDSVELHLFRANDYDNYSYGSLRDSSLTAERVSLELMKLNYQVFGYKEFIITDSLLFADDTGIDSNLVYRTAKLKPGQQNGFAGNNINTNNFIVQVIELCNWGSCPPAERNGNLSRNITPGGGGTPSCRTCWTVTILNDFPDGSPNPTDPGGGGGGMGTPPANGNCTGTTNCRESSRILEGRLPCGNCGPGPIVVIPPDTYDPNEAASIIIDTSISNNYPCLTMLLTNMPNVNRETQKFMNNAFGIQKNVHLVFAMKPSLDTLTDAETASPVFINNPDSRTFTDTIYLNPYTVRRATKEYTVATIFHESFHAYYNYLYTLYSQNIIDSNRIKTELPLFWELGVSPTATAPWVSQHEEMANNYLGAIENIVKYYYNPLAPDSIRNRVSRSIAWGGLEESTIWSLPGRDSCRIWADINAARSTHYNPTLSIGGCPTYNYNYHSLSLNEPCD